MRGVRELRRSTFVGNPAAFHAIEWTPASIKWFVDGVQYVEANIQNSVNSTEEFHRPFFALLNLAVGGNWPGSPDGATAFPSRLQVDYVRVYQQNAGGGTISPTAWYTVQNVNSTLCADQANGSMANGTPVQQWPCQNGLNQQWRSVPRTAGTTT